MTNDVSSIPLQELSTSAPLNPVEATTIVRELALRVTRGTIPGVPSLHVIRLTSSGMIAVEGPVAADARTVAHAAHLLDTLLPGFDVPPDIRVPGALRLIVARALGTLDLPAYESLESFAAALSRFANDDPERSVRGLVSRWRQRCTPPHIASVPAVVNASPVYGGDAITISDIRRARRATGVTLAEISDRTRIPARLLCELEWGYLHHWPASHTARRLMVSYARAAGLDDQLVVRTAWPLLEESVRRRAAVIGSNVSLMETATEAIPSEAIPAEYAVMAEAEEEEPAELASAVWIPDRTSRLIAILPVVRARRSRWRSVIVAALAIPALLFIGVAPRRVAHVGQGANIPRQGREACRHSTATAALRCAGSACEYADAVSGRARRQQGRRARAHFRRLDVFARIRQRRQRDVLPGGIERPQLAHARRYRQSRLGSSHHERCRRPRA